MPDDRPAPKARFSSQELRQAEEVAQASVAHIREFILSTPGLNSHPSRNSTLEDDIRDVVDGRAGHYGARIRVEEITAAELEDPMEVIRVALRAAINAGNFEEFDGWEEATRPRAESVRIRRTRNSVVRGSSRPWGPRSAIEKKTKISEKEREEQERTLRNMKIEELGGKPRKASPKKVSIAGTRTTRAAARSQVSSFFVDASPFGS